MGGGRFEYPTWALVTLATICVIGTITLAQMDRRKGLLSAETENTRQQIFCDFASADE